MKTTVASRAFAIQGVTFGVTSNCSSLLSDEEYFSATGNKLHSLLSNFLDLEEVHVSDSADAAVMLHDDPASGFSVHPSPGRLTVTGPLESLERNCTDKRISIFGNMGLFSKFAVLTLESRGIYSFHSTSFYDRSRNRLYLVLGGSGSGKSTVLLAAIARGFEVFSTELTHATLEANSVVFHKGPVIQNCRVGNLVEDFPALIERFDIQGLPRENVWHEYRAVDLSSVAVPEQSLTDPDVTVVFPRIESGRTNSIVGTAGRYGTLLGLYEGLCDKVTPPSLVYGRYFVPSLDTPETAKRRFRFVERFIEQARINGPLNVLAGPHTCLDGIIENTDTGEESLHELQ